MVWNKAESKSPIDFVEYRQSLKQPKQKYGDYEFELLRRVRLSEGTSGWVTKPKFAAHLDRGGHGAQGSGCELT